MLQTFEGKLVRFDHSGLGVVDVGDLPHYVYFKPRDIKGYHGQTVEELKASHWKDGSILIIKGEPRGAGNVHVESVTLKI